MRNKYSVKGDVAEMVLYNTNGTERCICTIDRTDISACSELQWYELNGYITNSRYIYGKHYSLRLHNYLLGFSGNRKVQVDHIDRNPLNNVRSNLRICTHRQNLVNNSQKAGATGYRGVYHSACSDNYRARIKHRGRLLSIGTFPTAEEAALAWNNAALQYNGEFAVLNDVNTLHVKQAN